jgi:hypothetical protein
MKESSDPINFFDAFLCCKYARKIKEEVIQLLGGTENEILHEVKDTKPSCMRLAIS